MLNDANSPTVMFGVILADIDDPRAVYFTQGDDRYIGIRLKDAPRPGSISVYLGYRHPIKSVYYSHYSLMGKMLWIGVPLTAGDDWHVSYVEETWQERARRTWA